MAALGTRVEEVEAEIEELQPELDEAQREERQLQQRFVFAFRFLV